MSKLLFYILLSFAVFGCNNSKAPKKPAAAAVNPWTQPETNPYRNTYGDNCTGYELKDKVTNQCASRCSDGQARSNGQCAPCPNGVAAGSDGMCPQTLAVNGCSGQLAVQNQGPIAMDPRGFQYYLAQNASGITVKSYRCLPADSTCAQNTNAGQICVAVDPTGTCNQYDTRGASAPYTPQAPYGSNTAGGQTYQTTDVNGLSIQAFTCQPTDSACIQQLNAGNACTYLDSNRMCGNYTRLGSSAVRYGGSTSGYGDPAIYGNPSGYGVNGYCGGTPKIEPNANIQSCFPAGVVLNQPGFGGGYPSGNIKGYGAQGFGPNGGVVDPGLGKGGQVYDPRTYLGGGNGPANPGQMAQTNPLLSGLFGQISGINSDPNFQWQMSGNQYPIMFSTSPANHCQSYNRWIYQNMVITSGADPCGYVYNAVSALFCAGKMVVQRIVPRLNPVFRGRSSDEAEGNVVASTPTQPAQNPAPSGPVQNPAPSAPVQTKTGDVVTKGGPAPLPPAPPAATTTPTAPSKQVPPAPTKVAQVSKTDCVSRPCKLDGSYILSDLKNATNGASVEAVVPAEPAASPKDFPPNSAETAILAQVAKDKDGVLKLSFSSPDKGVKITKFNYKSGPNVDLAKTGPILYADVTWTTASGYTCIGITDTFSAVKWAQPKPLNGKCTK